jgi:hypothetical protein
MRRNRRPRPPEARRPLRSGEPDLPSLIELERFTQASLRQWLVTKGNLDGLQRALHFELEPLRQRNEGRLLEALRSQALPSLSFEGWSRILDYRSGLQPLSVAGSLSTSSQSHGNRRTTQLLYLTRLSPPRFNEPLTSHTAGGAGGRPRDCSGTAP